MESKKFGCSLLDDDCAASSSPGRDGPAPSCASRSRSPSLSARFPFRRTLHSTHSAVSVISSCESSDHVAAASTTMTTTRTTTTAALHLRSSRRHAGRDADRERLEYPVLRCTLRFPDHDAMTRYIHDCDCVVSCEYWCYHHRCFEQHHNDSRSTRSLAHESIVHESSAPGHESKRRKMLSRAKRLFSGLGYKGKSVSLSPSPSLVSADSACMPADLFDCSGKHHHSSRRCSGDTCRTSACSFGESLLDCQAASGISVELPTHEAPVEIDSRELDRIPQPPPLIDQPISVIRCAQVSASVSASVSAPVPAFVPALMPEPMSVYTYSPEEPPLAYPFVPQPVSVNPQDVMLPELESAMDLEPHNADMLGSEELAFPYSPTSDFVGFTFESQALLAGQRPLRPSCSVRSTASNTSTTSTASTDTVLSAVSNATTVSTVTTMSSMSMDNNMLASPISECRNSSISWSGGEESGLSTSPATVNTSPTDEFCDFFNASDALYAGIEEMAKERFCELDASADSVFGLGAMSDMDALIDYSYSALPLPLADVERAPALAPVPVPTSTPQPATTAALTQTPSVVLTTVDVSTAQPDSESKRIVTVAWDMLMAHVSSSLRKLDDARYADNPVATLLRSTAPEQVADTGIRALQTALALGEGSMDPFTLVCLLHVVYAWALVTYDSDAPSHLDGLFAQVLSYARGYAGSRHDSYLQVVMAIWQPVCGWSPGGLLATDLAGNPILGAAEAFLDVLEIVAILRAPKSYAPPLAFSPLFAKHMQHERNGGDLVSSRGPVLDALCREFPKAAKACRNAAGGAPSSVRRLELELLRAGQEFLGSYVFFHEFAPRVRHLCDPLYVQHETAAHQRLAYYEQSLGWIRSVLFESGGTEGMGGMALEATVSEALAAPGLAPVAVAVSVAAPVAVTVPVAVAVAAPATPGTPQPKDAKPHIRCKLCDYRPTGDPQWFRGSLNKHMKTMHSSKKVYKCPFPNCTSEFRNREDNLKKHQKEKNHYVGEQSATRKLVHEEAERPRKRVRR